MFGLIFTNGEHLVIPNEDCFEASSSIGAFVCSYIFPSCFEDGMLLRVTPDGVNPTKLLRASEQMESQLGAVITLRTKRFFYKALLNSGMAINEVVRDALVEFPRTKFHGIRVVLLDSYKSVSSPLPDYSVLIGKPPIEFFRFSNGVLTEF